MSNKYYNLLYGIDELFQYLDEKPSWYDQFMNIFHEHTEHDKVLHDLIALNMLIGNSRSTDVRMKIALMRLLYTQIDEDISLAQTVALLINLIAELSPRADRGIMRPYLECLLFVLQEHDIDPDVIGDHLSRGQIASKFDLINTIAEFANQNPEVYSGLNKQAAMLGGWYATIVPFLQEFLGIEKVLDVDIDAEALEVAQSFNRDIETFDILEADATAFVMTKDAGDYDLIINTSAEHMDDSWFVSIPSGTVVAIQTNDYKSLPEHVNCVKTLEEAVRKYPMNNVITSELNTGLYTRFTLVGTVM